MANIIQTFPKGTGKGGHTILDDGTAVTERDTLNLTDFDIADDSTNQETDIAPHRLTSAELDDIVSGVPNITLGSMPVVFDERGTEYVIGRYIKSDGTETPLYQKTFKKTMVTDGSTIASINISGTYVLRELRASLAYADSTMQESTFYYSASNYWSIWVENGNIKGKAGDSSYSGKPIYITIQYTKD